jgi:hypothetical protein
MNLRDINFNFKEIKASFLRILREKIHPSFVEIKRTEDLWEFRATEDKRVIVISALENGRVRLSLERKGLESCFVLKRPETEEIGDTLKEVEKAIPHIKHFITTGTVNEKVFEKIPAAKDDWL